MITTTTTRHDKWSQHHRDQALKRIQAMEDELVMIKHLLAALRSAPGESPSIPHIVKALHATRRDSQDTPDPAPADQTGGS